MYQTIVSAIDGSEQSVEAAKQAIELGASADGTVHFLFVMETKPTFTKVGLGGLGDLAKSDEYKAYAEEKISEVEALAADGGVAAVGTVKSSSSPHAKIVEYAEEEEADLIVVGSHGADVLGARGGILGSTSERVVRRSPISVLVAR